MSVVREDGTLIISSSKIDNSIKIECELCMQEFDMGSNDDIDSLLCPKCYMEQI